MCWHLIFLDGLNNTWRDFLLFIPCFLSHNIDGNNDHAGVFPAGRANWISLKVRGFSKTCS